MSEIPKRNIFERDPETHLMVITKDNQLALHHDDLDLDYIIELDCDSVPGSITVHYAFDPEYGELTMAEEKIIIEDTKLMLNNAFAQEVEDEDA